MSKDLQPNTSAFFPTIFFKNQFGTKPKWAPKDTDLTGKTAIVTGSNQGLGLEASDQLLSLKLSRLIIAVRSPEKGEAAARSLQAKHPTSKIDVMNLDMASYESIQTFVEQVKQLDRLDIVILNAGIRNLKFATVASTGHEATIQVNYISTALLCIQLLPVLKHKAADGPGRMTIVSSGLAFDAKFANRNATPLLPSFDHAKAFNDTDTYNTSKLLGHMLLYQLADYVSADEVIVNAVDPGFVKGTNLTHDLSLMASMLFAGLKKVAARPVDVGASTYVDAAVVKGKDSHGCYIMSWEISPFASLLYTLDGQQIINRLWRETMAELQFANVQSILEGLRDV